MYFVVCLCCSLVDVALLLCYVLAALQSIYYSYPAYVLYNNVGLVYLFAVTLQPVRLLVYDRGL